LFFVKTQLRFLGWRRAKVWDSSVDSEILGLFPRRGIAIADLFSLRRIGILEENVTTRTG
jgi:hypothetical protein